MLGDCTPQKEIPERYGWCRFTHSWHKDTTNLLDIEALDLVNGMEEGLKEYLKFYVFRLLLVLFLVIMVVLIHKSLTRTPTKQKQK